MKNEKDNSTKHNIFLYFYVKMDKINVYMKGQMMKKVICIIYLLLVLVINGCSCSTDKKISVEPKPEPSKNLYNY